MSIRLISSRLLRPALRIPRISSSRANSTHQPPPPNPHREFYRGLGRPVAFNFLIALATFQALHWSWLKLESMELQETKNQEITDLKNELKDLTAAQSGSK